MTATNTLNKGLVMDFNPTLTKEGFLTNALNATLLTFNGSEMALQQDMGNGRVETAFLPKGYIPVGSCEFGDVIYIVSYNPLEDKSQIGCFPSPERYISSDEVTPLQQALSAEDFQEISDIDNNPTGVLKAVSVKKILYGNRNLNPGDKYIIYEEDGDVNDSALEKNKGLLSDYANTMREHGMWPKLVKVNVVSIEDSGRIVNLNASVKWYDNDYYIAQLKKTDATGRPDIDSYRNLVSSAYSVFQSKVSGKLALLIELESPQGFSCTYDVYTYTKTAENKETTDYWIWFYTSWQTDHNDVNPSGFIFTDSKWIEGGGVTQYYTKKEDSTVQVTKTECDLPVKSGKKDDGGYDAEKVCRYSLLYSLTHGKDETFENYIKKSSYNAQIDAILDWKREENGTYSAIYDSAHAEAAAEEVKEDTGFDAQIEKFNNRAELRSVTKINRITDLNPDGESTPSGMPKKYTPDENETKIAEAESKSKEWPVLPPKWKYVYNVDYYRKKENTSGQAAAAESDEQYEYYTKKINGKYLKLEEIALTDDVVVNTFKKDVPMLVTDEKTPFSVQRADISTSDSDKQTVVRSNVRDLSKLIWNYEVAPVMPYGVLDWLAVSGSIDFSKVGTGEVDLTAWRYYCSGNIATLTWGLEAYPEPNKGISEVVMDFYDNQGSAASWHVSGLTSYSGTFTEQITLGVRYSSYRMTSRDAYGQDYIHAGDVTEDNPEVYLDESTGKPSPPKDVKAATRVNDAGTIYANALYLVRITVKYGPKDVLGEYSEDNKTAWKTYWRWFWSNGMFNDSYYSVKDFDILKPRLALDFQATFDTRGVAGEDGKDYVKKMRPQIRHYYNPGDIMDNSEQYVTVGASVHEVNQDGADDEQGNICMKIEPCLADDFGTFNLAEKEGEESLLKKLAKVKIMTGKSSIELDNTAPGMIHSGADVLTPYDDNIRPLLAEKLCSHDSSGWDLSGYASYGYGANGVKPGAEFLKLLTRTKAEGGKEVTPQIYSSTVDTAESKTLNNPDGTPVTNNAELYASGGAYQSYLDSFSLNICKNGTGDSNKPKLVQSNDNGTKPLVYYDKDGNEVTVQHWQELETDLKTLREKGVGLTLAGTMFSKLFASGIIKDTEAKKLISLIGSAANAESGNDKCTPERAGLHYYEKTVSVSTGGDTTETNKNEGHMYFTNAVTFGAKDERGHRTEFSAATWRNMHNDTFAISDIQDNFNHFGGKHTHLNCCVKQPGNYWNTEIMAGRCEKFLQVFIWLDRGTDAYEHMEAIGCNNLNYIHDCFNVQRGSSGKANSFADDERCFNAQNYIEYKAAGTISSPVTDENWVMYQQPIIFDKATGYTLLLSDMFISSWHSQEAFNYATSGTKYKRTDSLPKDEGTLPVPPYPICRTFADMFASLLIQLYVYDPTAELNLGLADNLTVLEDYTEFWNKDIIVEADTATEKDAKQPDPGKWKDNFRDYVTIHGQQMSEYVKWLNDNVSDESSSESGLKWADGINTNNIDIIVQGTKRTFTLQYSIPYDVRNILQTYQSTLAVSSNRIALAASSDGTQPKTERFFNDIKPSVLYTWTGSDVIPFGSTSVIRYAKKFHKIQSDSVTTGYYAECPSDNYYLMSGRSFAGLAQCIKYSEGSLWWEDVSKLPEYDNQIDYVGITGHSDKFYVRETPSSSLFWKYNVSH